MGVHQLAFTNTCLFLVGSRLRYSPSIKNVLFTCSTEKSAPLEFGLRTSMTVRSRLFTRKCPLQDTICNPWKNHLNVSLCWPINHARLDTSISITISRLPLVREKSLLMSSKSTKKEQRSVKVSKALAFLSDANWMEFEITVLLIWWSQKAVLNCNYTVMFGLDLMRIWQKRDWLKTYKWFGSICTKMKKKWDTVFE